MAGFERFARKHSGTYVFGNRKSSVVTRGADKVAQKSHGQGERAAPAICCYLVGALGVPALAAVPADEPEKLPTAVRLPEATGAGDWATFAAGAAAGNTGAKPAGVCLFPQGLESSCAG